MAEISFWNEALHLGQALATGRGGGLNPWRPALVSGLKPVRVYISPPPPLSSGKLARLMLRQRDGGADGVSRWPLVAVALARRSEASDRRPGFMSRVKWFQD